MHCKFKSVTVHGIYGLISQIIFHGLVFFIFSDLIKISPVTPFNIDEEYPIVIKNNFHKSNAHFGIAVNLLQNKRTNTLGGGPTGWILISAPKANSSYLNHSNIFEPGVIWRCALGRSPEPREDDCRIMLMDRTAEYDPKTPSLPQKARKDGGWLGGAMNLDSNRFVACASRWVNQKYKDSYLMNGMCYWIPTDQVISDNVNKNWPLLPPNFSYRLSALLAANRQTVNVPNETNLINGWSFGQFGFSVSIAKNNDMIIGAPGVLDWTGSVIQFKNASPPRTQYKRFNFHPTTPAFSEVFVADVQNKNESSIVLDYYDYFGYAVAAGEFFNSSVSQNRTQFASGAPRSASLSGKVLVFSFRKTENSASTKLDYLVDPIEAPKDRGEGYASYFGSVISAGDMNADGYDDLLIGAPFFGTIYTSQLNSHTSLDNFDFSNNTSYEAQTGKPEKPWRMTSGDEGCVFVYLSTGYDFKRSPQEICGDRIPGARFGSAISIMGDINWDGYKDIAVSAPYENDNRGAVYIYHGGDYLTFAQKLSPELINPNIRTFGYSLSTGVDVDGNEYPDLAVGAYESNHVVIFRTIPLVKFNASVFSTIPKILPSTLDFNITACISFNGKSLPDNLDLVLKLSINHDITPGPKRFITWMIHESQKLTNLSNLLQPILTTSPRLLNFKKHGSCYNFTALRIGKLEDVTTQFINISMIYWIDGMENTAKSQPLLYEIVQSSTGNPQLKFDKSQPGFHSFSTKKLPISVTNMFGEISLSLSIATICEADGNPVCLANLTLDARFRDRNDEIFDSKTPFILGSSDIMTLEIDVWNHKEIARDPTIDLIWNSPPSIRKYDMSCFTVNGLITNKHNHYRCNLSKIIHENKMDRIRMDFDVTGLYAGEVSDSFVFKVKAGASSELVNEPEEKFELPLRYQMEVLNYSYEYEIEYATDIPTDIFNISQAFEINLSGLTPIYKAQMEIHIPKYLEINGESHEFILIRRPIVSYDGIYSCKALNGSFLEEPMTFSTRQSTTENIPYFNESLEDFREDEKFDTFLSEDARIARDVMSKKLGRMKRSTVDSLYNIFNLDNNLEGEYGLFKIRCGDPGVTCMTVTCDIMHFQGLSKSIVELKLRLKNSVTKMLINENYDVESISIETSGVLRMLDKQGQKFGNVANLNSTTKLMISEPVEIPAWILIVSIASGLLLLTAITVALVKVGFFQRTKKKELELLKVNDQADRYF